MDTTPLTATSAEHICTRGDLAQQKAMVATADLMWPPSDDDFDSDHAEIARFARLAAYRLELVGESDWMTVALWQHRHIAAASTSGNVRSLALGLQQPLFLLASSGHFRAAHSLLDSMGALVATSTNDAAPAADLVDRILAERRALLYLMEENWPEATTWYERAYGLAPAGSRSEAKVRGGLALARWLGGGSSEAAVTAFSDLVDCSSDWADVMDAARLNLAAAQLGDRSAATQFDLL